MIKKAMILAAGFGKRMQPLTLEKPKPLLKIDKETLLSNTLKFLEQLKIKQVVINVHYMGDQIIQYIKEDGVSYLKDKFSQTIDQSIPLSFDDATDLALRTLFLHELGHFGVEMLHTELENIRALAQNNITYHNYVNEKNNNPQLEHNEEAFCNWNVKRQSMSFKFEVANVEIDYYPLIDDFMRNQPPGYRNFTEISNLNYGNYVIGNNQEHIFYDYVNRTKFRRHLGLKMVTRPNPKVPLYLVQSPP